MCDKAVRDEYCSVWFVPDQFVLDWFITRQQIKCLRDDNDDWYDNKLIERYNGYKKRKAQKAKIKEELLPIAWHSSKYWDWCMSEDEKQEREKLWG